MLQNLDSINLDPRDKQETTLGVDNEAELPKLANGAPIPPGKQKYTRRDEIVGRMATYARDSGPTVSNSQLADVSEQALLESATGFNEKALTELYDRYEARIYSYVYRRTGNETIAEDLTAEVILKMLKAIRGNKTWHTSFSGWLYRIAHNAVIDYYRLRDRQQQVPIDDLSNTMPTLEVGHNPVVLAELGMDSARLQRAIAQLTDEQAEVIKLRFFEGYSIEEVADMLDKTEGSIKALQYRAVTTLRQLLQHEEFN